MTSEKIIISHSAINSLRIGIENAFINAHKDNQSHSDHDFRSALLDFGFLELIHSYKNLTKNKDEFLSYMSDLYDSQEKIFNELMKNSVSSETYFGEINDA